MGVQGYHSWYMQCVQMTGRALARIFLYIYVCGCSPQRMQIHTVPQMSHLYEKTACLLQIEYLENLHFNRI